jgi:hypothetical protein
MEAQKGTFHINARLAAGMYSMQLTGPGSPTGNSINAMSNHSLGQQAPGSMQVHASQHQLHSTGNLNKKPRGSYGQLPQTGLDSSGAMGLQGSDGNREAVRLVSAKR